jgi:hypothetical protein
MNKTVMAEEELNGKQNSVSNIHILKPKINTMKTNLPKLMLCLCFSISIFSCKKNKNEEQAVQKKRYILSIEFNGTTNTNVTKYFVNDVATAVGNTSTEKIYGEDLEVAGNDVYVLATRQMNSSGAYSAVIYKNGVEIQTVPLGANIYYNCLAVSGNDIYLAGSESPSGGSLKVLLWKNGTVTSITTNTGANATEARPYDMTVVGNDVYIAGYESATVSPYNRLPKYWKNGVPVTLSSDAGTNCILHRILVNGTDVYASGTQGNKPAYWKNGTKTNLGTADGWCYGIAVSGNDIYTAGSTMTSSNIYNATSWKNGIPTMLSNLQGSVAVYGIGVDGSDVYVIGSVPQGSGSKSVYWKNGVLNELPSAGGTNAFAYRLVVK